MANITRKWRRIMALGCSHGQLIDKQAKAAVLKFRQDWNPHDCIHLGDFLDTAAFRGGARGTPDEAEPIQPDLEHGLDFIEQLEPTLVFAGNHENRLWHLAVSPNAVVSHCAQAVLTEIEDTCKKLKAELVPYHVLDGWRRRGNYLFGHGYWFNQMAARDGAEALGNVVFAHTHTTAMQKGRRLDNPTGYTTGTLANIPNMDYASRRRQTMAWSQGFVWGEYCDTKTILWLHENGNNRAGERWRLPHC